MEIFQPTPEFLKLCGTVAQIFVLLAENEDSEKRRVKFADLLTELPSIQDNEPASARCEELSEMLQNELQTISDYSRDKEDELEKLKTELEAQTKIADGFLEINRKQKEELAIVRKNCSDAHAAAFKVTQANEKLQSDLRKSKSAQLFQESQQANEELRQKNLEQLSTIAKKCKELEDLEYKLENSQQTFVAICAAAGFVHPDKVSKENCIGTIEATKHNYSLAQKRLNDVQATLRVVAKSLGIDAEANRDEIINTAVKLRQDAVTCAHSHFKGQRAQANDYLHIQLCNVLGLDATKLSPDDALALANRTVSECCSLRSEVECHRKQSKRLIEIIGQGKPCAGMPLDQMVEGLKQEAKEAEKLRQDVLNIANSRADLRDELAKLKFDLSACQNRVLAYDQMKFDLLQALNMSGSKATADEICKAVATLSKNFAGVVKENNELHAKLKERQSFAAQKNITFFERFKSSGPILATLQISENEAAKLWPKSESVVPLKNEYGEEIGTARLYSSEPELQNIPPDAKCSKELREAFSEKPPTIEELRAAMKQAGEIIAEGFANFKQDLGEVLETLRRKKNC